MPAKVHLRELAVELVTVVWPVVGLVLGLVFGLAPGLVFDCLGCRSKGVLCASCLEMFKYLDFEDQTLQTWC